MALAAGLGGRVWIDYTGTGVEHRAALPGGTGSPVRPHVWLEAFLLAFVAGVSDENGDLFVAAAPALAGQESRPDVALVHALLIYVYGCAEGWPETAGPLSETNRAELIGTICDGVDPDPTLGRQYRSALVSLRALATGDREGFARSLAAQLERHRAVESSYGRPTLSGLLPMDAIALAAMAVRWHEWELPVESGYLPRGPVSGFRPPPGRVGPYGRHKRPDADPLPLVVDRPEHPYARYAAGDGTDSGSGISAFEEYVARELALFHDIDGDPAEASRALEQVMRGHLWLFLHRVAGDPEGRDPALPDLLRTATEAGAAALRLGRAPKGTLLPVTVGATTRTVPSRPGEAGDPGFWKETIALALITGDRVSLAACVLVEPSFFTAAAPHLTDVAAYGAALHDYLRGEDPVPAVDRALTIAASYDHTRTPTPPVTLLSQVVEGDREGFALALADTLEKHRDHYATGDRADTHHAVLDLDALALVCHVHRMGWQVPVSSPYLPARILNLGARPDTV
ncbi:Imm49 family immunity protein [Streptomyces sp. NPDC058953]|uniref:immunity 49 family protein n=1 Tax=Streptomyces sp. NPDC058953 TaxID=3346676 RepID=UPI0036CBD3F3